MAGVVVGVVGDVRLEESTKAAPLEVLFHFLQGPTGRIALALRVDPSVYRSPLLLEPAVRRAVMSVDSTQPVTQVAEMRQLISDRIAPKRLSAQLIGAFATLALVLAAVGIYGVLSFSVAQRTHEIGIRLALGARPDDVCRMVIRQGMRLVLIGGSIGLAGALALTRLMSTLLFGIKPGDPVTFATVTSLLIGIAWLACYLPARRATKVDPLTALRHE